MSQEDPAHTACLVCPRRIPDCRRQHWTYVALPPPPSVPPKLNVCLKCVTNLVSRSPSWAQKLTLSRNYTNCNWSSPPGSCITRPQKMPPLPHWIIAIRCQRYPSGPPVPTAPDWSSHHNETSPSSYQGQRFCSHGHPVVAHLPSPLEWHCDVLGLSLKTNSQSPTSWLLWGHDLAPKHHQGLPGQCRHCTPPIRVQQPTQTQSPTTYS